VILKSVPENIKLYHGEKTDATGFLYKIAEEKLADLLRGSPLVFSAGRFSLQSSTPAVWAGV